MEEKEKAFELVESRDALELMPRWEAEAWWFFVAAGLLILGIFLYYMVRRNRAVIDPDRAKREAYVAAKKELEDMETKGSRRAAADVSLILRRYLARSMNEPALFETHEEFVGRHEGLMHFPEDVKARTESFFARLAGMKYAPDDALPASDPSLKADGAELLERIHRA